MTQSSAEILKLNPITKDIVDCAYQIHTYFGPGLLENIYHEAFIIELKNRDIKFESEKIISLNYKDQPIKSNMRLDLLIDNEIIVELKSIEKTLPVHKAQLLSYMKLANKKLGFLINFNVPLIKDGIQRFAL